MGFQAFGPSSSQDLDLDLRELGGNLTWQEPEDMSQVTSYAPGRKAYGWGWPIGMKIHYSYDQ